jgi:hypothetical protein
VIYAQAPAREVSSLVGRFIYTLEYEFSGRRDPLGPEAKFKHSPSSRDADGDVIMSPQEPDVVCNRLPIGGPQPEPPKAEHNDMYA